MTAKAAIRRQLLNWFDRSKRLLPWRATRDPYAVLVSEVMLQQTRVETVIPYYLRFLARFPDARALAAAPEADVLAAWAGLGYYRRARMLKRAAEAVVATRDGRFPEEVAELRLLPGIGRYTAGAVASIAFEQEEPLVDGNVARVLSRLFRIEGETRARETSSRLWQLAADLVRGERPGDFNQALMELGAVVCVPRAPKCDACPVARNCLARESGEVERFPEPPRRTKTVDVRLACCVVTDGSRVALVRRAAGTRMAGLLDVPAIELGDPEVAAEGPSVAAALSHHLDAELGLVVRDILPVGSIRHSITHHRIRVEVHRGRLAKRRTPMQVRERPQPRCEIAAVADAAGVVWIDGSALDVSGIAALGRKSLSMSGVAAGEDSSASEGRMASGGLRDRTAARSARGSRRRQAPES